MPIRILIAKPRHYSPSLCRCPPLRNDGEISRRRPSSHLSLILLLSLFAVAWPQSTTVQSPPLPTSLQVNNTGAQSGTWQCWGPGVPDPCYTSLYSVSMISATDGWAVGNGGTILRWDGITWSTFSTSPVNSWALLSVAMAEPGESLSAPVARGGQPHRARS